MEGYERKEGMDNDREEIYSKAVRAGKRTYFFDVKSTRNNDYYLTITESTSIWSGEIAWTGMASSDDTVI